MKTYEVSREIYNSCSGKYRFDNSFFREVETDSPEMILKSWLPGNMPEFDKNILSDGSIEYILHLPLKERYTFSEI